MPRIARPARPSHRLSTRGGEGVCAGRGPRSLQNHSKRENILQREVLAVAAADDRLADALGLPSDVVKIHRNSCLTEGVHFLRGEGGRVDYTPEGEEAVRAALSAQKKEAAPPAPLPPDAPEKKEGAAPPAEPGSPVLLKLLRRYPNPIWIDVQAGAERVLVRVKNNNLLAADKRVLCRQWPAPDGRWECCQRGQAFPLKPLAGAP